MSSPASPALSEPDIDGFVRLENYDVLEIYMEIESVTLPDNIYDAPVREIVRKMQTDQHVAVNESQFVDANKGYMYTSIVEQHVKEERKKKILLPAHVEAQELPTDLDSVRGNIYAQGKQINGPCQVENMQRNQLLLRCCSAGIIGTRVLCMLTADFTCLNLGLSTYTDQERVKEVGMFLEDIRIRLQVPGWLSNMTILIECPMHIEKYKNVHYLAVLVEKLAAYQREYRGAIVLLFPPFLPADQCTLQAYQEGKEEARRWARIGHKLGKLHGLATMLMDVQYESHDRDTVLAMSCWTVDTLMCKFGPTEEFYFRFGTELTYLLKAVQRWAIPEFGRAERLF